MIIATMATYPARQDSLRFTLPLIRAQVDRLFVVANEYESVPEFMRAGNVEVLLPDEDLKDAGKFARAPFDESDLVFLMDDDIIYPPDYVATMKSLAEEISLDRRVLGVHGVIYSDFFDGSPSSRVVYGFEHPLEQPRVVNQLGTGTVMARGDRIPALDRIRTAKGFVDVRFAALCYERELTHVCVPRPARWLRAVETDETLFETVTRQHGRSPEILDEIASFGGFARLPATEVAALEG